MKLSFFEFLILLLVGLIVGSVLIGGLFAIIEWAYPYLKIQ